MCLSGDRATLLSCSVLALLCQQIAVLPAHEVAMDIVINDVISREQYLSEVGGCPAIGGSYKSHLGQVHQY